VSGEGMKEQIVDNLSEYLCQREYMFMRLRSGLTYITDGRDEEEGNQVRHFRLQSRVLE